MIDSELIKILRCPVSGEPLELDEENNRLLCPQARLYYPIRDGIMVLLKDEAQPYEPNDS